MKQVEFILYVSDQSKSRDFYKKVLKIEPSLDIDGMTEFLLTENCMAVIPAKAGI